MNSFPAIQMFAPLQKQELDSIHAKPEREGENQMPLGQCLAQNQFGVTVHGANQENVLALLRTISPTGIPYVGRSDYEKQVQHEVPLRGKLPLPEHTKMDGLFTGKEPSHHRNFEDSVSLDLVAYHR
jgi:hypothetical protein